MVLLVDNYDSFSYNVVQLFGSVLAGKEEIKVIRNDEMTVEEVMNLNPSHLIISPGPGRPCDAGICEDLIREAAGKIPVLGICLGHQAISEVFGFKVDYARKLMHGKKSVVDVDTDCKIFAGLDKKQEVARYHSLVAVDEKNDAPLVVTAVDENGEIMAVKHRNFEVYGVQFHPESVLTKNGEIMVRNFLNIN